MDTLTAKITKALKKYKDFRVIKSYNRITIQKGTAKSLKNRYINPIPLKQVMYFEGGKLVRLERLKPVRLRVITRKVYC